MLRAYFRLTQRPQSSTLQIIKYDLVSTLDITKITLMEISKNHPNENKSCFIQFAIAREPTSITYLWWGLINSQGMGKVFS